ncbi:MAG: diaminopimelate epimerase [Muribaculaceae bacterium]|nr:diaminopimelate epimerase [Muribaculaceae bacterium]
MTEKIEFTKMHGCGNDYIYIDCRRGVPNDIEGLARRLSRRHTGVGGDGIILVCASDRADFKMRIFNADGSEGKMCGNGIRCVAKFVYDKGFTDRKDLMIDTLSGVKHVVIAEDARPGDEEIQVTVDMGLPVVESAEESVSISEGVAYRGACISMGNPHFVCFVDEYPGDSLVLGDGPQIERHPRFPDRTNVEFARIAGKSEIEMRVWERGSGETMACGTGACAVAVAAITAGLTEKAVTVHLRGGDLRIALNDDGHVMMTGPAATAFEGKCIIENLEFRI